MTTYAVTGATGGLGGAAVDALIARGVDAADIVAIVRDRGRAERLAAAGVEVRIGDYNDSSSLDSALAGVDRLLLVSGNELGSRLTQHTNVIAAATRVGVPLIAYTSILKADTSVLSLAGEHLATERLLAETGVDHILLRNGWYWENYVPSAPAAVASGVLYGSSADGLVAGAARADYADAAAVALIDGTGGTIYELGGSEHLSSSDIAAAIADVAGKPVRYQDLSEADYASALRSAGLPEPVAAMLADSDAGIAQGALNTDSTSLADLRGRPSTPLTTVLAESGPLTE
ncbi:NmrA family NAD(P)-binding protein [Gordonia sp. ABSL1-1]|uniref:NmrA family NAD(P)-binding protein n=1 Tax=Gordonia sp. ABSL1-1 TaxID=3053923 RepID=UPI00257251E2|nr:NmrA family NAD(P)-binding protein [Gordonia sp. ABSL1-1]MDL9936841.1 NmrA family NAD(P)-binding protein [Gordonia sp. ABSL1-1]